MLHRLWRFWLDLTGRTTPTRSHDHVHDPSLRARLQDKSRNVCRWPQ
jgi:hypothetical protein